MTANGANICFLLCVLVLANITEARPADNTFDSLINRTGEFFNSIYDPAVNQTKDFVDGISKGIDKIFGSVVTQNRSRENGKIFDDINDTDRAHVGNVTYDAEYEMEISDRMKNCSIVVGGALVGAVIGTLAVGVGVPLILCLFGFTCWGIMAGSAAACCQSGIGNVPAGSCFSCLQSTGAGGGGCTYVIFACVIGIPLGLCLGGYYADSYFNCFSSM